jgi:hypothetical protein
MSISATAAVRPLPALPPDLDPAQAAAADPVGQPADERAASTLIAQAGSGGASRVDRPNASRDLGAFHLQNYLGFRGPGGDLQVALGYTDNGYTAIRTQTSTYAVPAHATDSRESIRQWVQHAYAAGAISGVWPLNPTARSSAPATSTPAQVAAAPAKPVTFTDILGAAAPDALVVTVGALNQANGRHFALLNPVAGTATHFIGHKGGALDQITIGTLPPLKRVETVHYALDGSVRREDGYGVTGKVGDATWFFNIRAGDTNLRANPPGPGASVNVGFFGPPKALDGMAEALKQSPNPQVNRAGELLDRGLALASVGGSEFGLGWRGTITQDPATGRPVLNLSGLKIGVEDFTRALASPENRNLGDRPTAAAINRENYIRGANPYELADHTRDAAGNYRNHGDPVSAIAGNIQQLSAELPNGPTVRTNAEARRVLEAVLQRPSGPISPDFLRMLSPEDRQQLLEPLSPQAARALSNTLTLLNRYGLDFGSRTIHDAAAAAASRTATQPADRQFVRDVFEGDFRLPSMRSDGNLLVDGLVFGANRWVALFASILDASGVADGSRPLHEMRAAQDGLQARLAHAQGGVLPALGMNVAGLSAAERGRLENAALSVLASELIGRARRPNDSALPTGQALYNTFLTLTQAEKAALAARINALRSP